MKTEVKTLGSSLKMLVNSLYKAAPALASTVMIVGCSSILILSLNTTLMMGSLILVVLITSLLIFSKKESFGEAALPLVGGLLTILRTEWTVSLYAVFMITWIAFALLAFLLSAIKVAAQQEELLKEAAAIITKQDLSKLKSVESELKEFCQISEAGQLGPIERAKLIRLLAFRKIDIQLYSTALNSVEVLKTITRVEPEKIVLFLADFFQVLKIESHENIVSLVDELYEVIWKTPVQPVEFFNAFSKCRKFLVDSDLSPHDFIHKLSLLLTKGCSVSEISEEFKMGR
ncbi:MAG: hypothetical protein HC795_08780 [Coleofasciculaceae cyanobacterium RL_1_1]|nr:hypothetical protein [Coleofasciculaceae cyanobacterium RL_1_1]